MQDRKFGTWALTVALSGLAAACADSTGTTQYDPDESDGDGAVAESKDEIRPSGGPWGNNPYGNDPWGNNPYDPWGNNPYDNNPYDNNPYDNNPYDNNPYDNNPYDNAPWNNGPWGSNLGGYDHQVTSRLGSVLPASAGIGSGLTGVAWVSAYLGGIGGDDYSVACEAGEVATGMYGRADTSVDQMGLYCSPVGAAGELGTEVLRGFTGGSGGTYFVSRCPSGQAIAGFAGRSNTLVTQVRLVCDSIPGTTLFYGDTFGGVAGDEFFAISPHRFFVTRLTGRSGHLVDALQAIHHYIGP